MENLAFDRAYHLEVVLKTSSTSERRAIITDARMSLKCNYSSKVGPTSTPSQILTLYNIDPSLIPEFKKQGAFVILRAGYLSQLDDTSRLEDLPVVMEADIMTCKMRYTDVDTILVLGLVEFAEEKKSSTSQITIPKGVSLVNLLQQIATRVTDKVEIMLSSEKSQISLNKRRTYSSTPAEILRRVGLEFGLNVYYHRKVLYITDKDALHIQEFQATGLSPIRVPIEEILGGIDLSADFTKSTNEGGLEANFRLVFNPYLRVDRVIELYSKGGLDFTAKGTYRIIAFSHSLDTHGTNWDTEIVASAISDTSGVEAVDRLYDEVIYGNR